MEETSGGTGSSGFFLVVACKGVRGSVPQRDRIRHWDSFRTVNNSNGRVGNGIRGKGRGKRNQRGRRGSIILACGGHLDGWAAHSHGEHNMEHMEIGDMESV